MSYTIEEIKQENIIGKEYTTLFVNKRKKEAFKVITDGNTCTARIQSDYNLQDFRDCGSSFPKYVLRD